MEVVSTTDRGRTLRRAVAAAAAPSPDRASLGGVAPTGSPIDLEGFDLVTVRGGLIHHNDAFTDNLTVARQMGMMPAQDSAAEQRMTRAFNAKTKLTSGARRRRRRARRRGRLGRAGPAGALQRLPDRG